MYELKLPKGLYRLHLCFTHVSKLKPAPKGYKLVSVADEPVEV
jgi:hypothetical protein